MKIIIFFIFLFSLNISFVLSNEECAIVTLLYQNDFGRNSHAIGVETLAYSLKRVNTQLKMFVLVNVAVDEKYITQVQNAGWTPKIVSEIEDYEDASSTSIDLSFYRINILSLYEFKKIIYLDANTLVVDNIDNLCSCPGNHCGVIKEGFVDTSVFVVKPASDLFQYALNMIKQTRYNILGVNGFLNLFFKDSEHCDFFDPSQEILPKEQHTPCSRIPWSYNADVSSNIFHDNTWEFNAYEETKQPHIIHYSFFVFKPWFWWSYLYVSECWRWWDIHSEYNTGSFYGGIAAPILSSIPFFIIWIIISKRRSELNQNESFSQTNNYVTSLYRFSISIKLFIGHLLNSLAFFIAFIYTNQMPLNPVANIITFYFSYIILFDFLCITLFHYVFKKPQQINIVSNLNSKFSTKNNQIHEKSIRYRLLIYSSFSLLLVLLLTNVIEFKISIFLSIIWFFFIPGICHTFYILNHYKK